jgi:hypothetical protein
MFSFPMHAEVAQEHYRDLLREAENYRLAAGAARLQPRRNALMRGVCRLQLPVLEPVCAPQPAS